MSDPDLAAALRRTARLADTRRPWQDPATEGILNAADEIGRLRAKVAPIRRAWLLVTQSENGCLVYEAGRACSPDKCGCVAEQEMLIRDGLEGDPL